MIEKISGLDYGGYLQEHIFTPLEMRGTVLSQRNQTNIANRAQGYSRIQDNFVETDNDMTSFTMGDGSIYSSVEDLAK